MQAPPQHRPTPEVPVSVALCPKNRLGQWGWEKALAGSISAWAGIMIKLTIWNPLGMSSAGKSRGCVLVICCAASDIVYVCDCVCVTVCMWVTVYVDHLCVVSLQHI